MLMAINAQAWASLTVADGHDVEATVRLVDAITAKRPDLVREEIYNGADINAVYQGYMILKYAIHQVRSGYTTLQASAESLEIIKSLIHNGAHLSLVLHDIAEEGFPEEFYKEIIDFTKAKGLSIDTVDALGQSALALAVRANNVNLVKLFLDNGANINRRDMLGSTPLYMAAEYADSNEIIDFLLQNGANPMLSFNKHSTAIHFAIIGMKSIASLRFWQLYPCVIIEFLKKNSRLGQNLDEMIKERNVPYRGNRQRLMLLHKTPLFFACNIDNEIAKYLGLPIPLASEVAKAVKSV